MTGRGTTGRHKTRRSFTSAYGPWALVAGGSDGLGAAFADELARRGLNLVLAARRAGKLGETAAALRGAHGVEVETVAADLASADAIEVIAAATAGRASRPGGGERGARPGWSVPGLQRCRAQHGG
jgi:NAD(P)-dependent dehydrogenase (short-subunit alcohol dehydrogenase family)